MKSSILRNSKGFTLIEIIGVLAVIAILAAMLAPRVFETIADSKSNRMANEIKAMKAAVANWYRDIGTLEALDGGGIPTNSDLLFQRDLVRNESVAGAGLWAKWNGPYLDSGLDATFYLSSVPIGGTFMTIQTQPTGTADFDLDGDGTDDTIKAGTQVVFLEIQTVDSSDFIRVDRILDAGMTDEGILGANQSAGKVEYAGTTMRIYIAHN